MITPPWLHGESLQPEHGTGSCSGFEVRFPRNPLWFNKLNIEKA